MNIIDRPDQCRPAVTGVSRNRQRTGRPAAVHRRFLAPAILSLWAGWLGSGGAWAAGGQALGWGYNADGELGDGSYGNANVPVAVSTTGVLNGKAITQVNAGYFHSCAVAAGGAYCWGSNNYGQLGDATYTTSNVAVAVDTTGVLSGKTLTQVSAGAYLHSCGLSADGRAYCWGNNASGQLGNATNTASNVPVAVDTTGVLSGKTLTQVSAGGNHSCTLTTDGLVYCWGYNTAGQLGNADNTSSNVPVAVTTAGVLSGKTVTQVSAGYYHSCARTADGGAYCWGYNASGQLGDAGNTNSNVPVAVGGALSGTPIIQIAAGSNVHSCALTTNGVAYCWGDNQYGQLGNAIYTTSNVPVAVDTTGVLSGKTVTQVAAGDYHSCALATDAAAYCWGDNYLFQLGNAGNTSSYVPVAVATSGLLSGQIVTQISASGDHSAALATPFCGPGLALATNQWQMLATPCVPPTPTVAGTFGNFPADGVNLDSTLYGAGGTGWLMQWYNSTTGAYAKETLSSSVAPGTGHWLKTLSPPVSQRLVVVNGTATIPLVTPAQGCASPYGCQAITLVGINRFNLVGNPFPYNVDWARVRVRVNGNAATLTPSAAALADILSKQIWIWNGTGYDTYDDSTLGKIGNLRYFQSFWVKTLLSAAGQTVELLIPAEPSTHAQAAPLTGHPPAAAARPWYLALLDWPIPSAAADPTAWYVRLTVDNPATGWQDHNPVLGQQAGALPGYDRNDLASAATRPRPLAKMTACSPGTARLPGQNCLWC